MTTSRKKRRDWSIKVARYTERIPFCTTRQQMDQLVYRASKEGSSIIGIIRKAVDLYMVNFPKDPKFAPAPPARYDPTPIEPVTLPDGSKKTVISGELADDDLEDIV